MPIWLVGEQAKDSVSKAVCPLSSCPLNNPSAMWTFDISGYLWPDPIMPGCRYCKVFMSSKSLSSNRQHAMGTTLSISSWSPEGARERKSAKTSSVGLPFLYPI